jgi:hypothetical protein
VSQNSWLPGGVEAKGEWPLKSALLAWFTAAYTFYFGGRVPRLYPEAAVLCGERPEQKRKGDQRLLISLLWSIAEQFMILACCRPFLGLPKLRGLGSRSCGGVRVPESKQMVP